MMTRRQFLSAAGASALLVGGYTWRIEPTWVELMRRELVIPGLASNWHGKLLVQLSDLHVGSQVDDAYLAGVFAKVAALRPDLVAYTGDFISYEGPQTLAKLRRHALALPRGTRGTVAVLGNHDYGHDWSQIAVADQVAGLLTQAGCTVLRNQVTDVGGLMIGGVDDLWSGRLDLAALWAAPKSPALVLCHNPDACDMPGWGGYRGWILAGHTHGGQCKPPFLPAPLLPVKNRRYTAGAFELSGGRQLYINRGLGHLLRVRFNVRPEVTVFRLAAEISSRGPESA